VEVSARDHQGDTPLHIATRTSTSDVIDWLVGRGASLDATNNAGETPRVLAAHNTNPFARLRFGSEMDIFSAAREGKVEAVATLLKADPTLANQTNMFWQTPLRSAVQAHRTNVVEYLEQHGAHWDAVSAVLAGRAEVLKGMLAREPGIITNALRGSTLLHLAAAEGNMEITRLLLGAGAEVRASDDLGLSPLGTALQSHRTEVVALLRVHGASENVFDAVYAGQLATLTALLSKDKSLARATNGAGLSVVEIAADTDHTDVLKLLLSKGAPASVANGREGRTPLHSAVIHNRASTAEVLIRQGAEVEAVDRYGFTPLHLAAWEGSAEVATLLLKHKADPNARTRSSAAASDFSMGRRFVMAGNSPLHLAAMSGQTNIIAVLLKAGALINATNSTGGTALDLASQRDCLSGPPWWSGLPRRVELPGAGESARPIPYSSLIERQRATISLLEKSGGKHSRVKQPDTGPFR
jgi:ankyrin repeat protein